MSQLNLDNYRNWPDYTAVYLENIHLLDHCFCANDCWRRGRGLIGRTGESAQNGLLLVPCNAVHNMFMAYAIDLVFLDKKGTILKIVKDFRPWRPYAGCYQAFATLELLAGRAAALNLQVGQQLTFFTK